MKRKKSLALLITIAMIMGLSACGENVIPEMTEEELQAVGEFAAVTLMKYDASHRSRLVDISLLEEEVPESVVPIEPTEPEGMRPTEDTPIENRTEIQNSYSMEEVMELPEGVTVSYVSHEFCDKYPNAGDNDYLAVTSSEGRKLLILKFSLDNASGQDTSVDILSTGCVFRITVNGDYTRRALTTLLPNDMSTYREMIPAGESKEVVLIIETEEERIENISSIVLNLKNELKTYTIQLF